MTKDIIVEEMKKAGYTLIEFQERPVFCQGATGFVERTAFDLALAPAKTNTDGIYSALLVAENIGLKFQHAHESHDHFYLRDIVLSDAAPAAEKPKERRGKK